MYDTEILPAERTPPVLSFFVRPLGYRTRWGNLVKTRSEACLSARRRISPRLNKVDARKVIAEFAEQNGLEWSGPKETPGFKPGYDYTPMKFLVHEAKVCGLDVNGPRWHIQVDLKEDGAKEGQRFMILPLKKDADGISAMTIRALPIMLTGKDVFSYAIIWEEPPKIEQDLKIRLELHGIYYSAI
jgi:hypothetical protein